jgi:uncharacterized protein (TIGR02118 family)
MYWVTILYPNKEGAKFDFNYYVNKHIPMTAMLFGHSIQILKGVASPLGAAPFLCTCRIPVTSLDEFAAKMSSEGAHLVADVPNYTNVEAVIQFEEVLQ